LLIGLLIKLLAEPRKPEARSLIPEIELPKRPESPLLPNKLIGLNMLVKLFAIGELVSDLKSELPSPEDKPFEKIEDRNPPEPKSPETALPKTPPKPGNKTCPNIPSP